MTEEAIKPEDLEEPTQPEPTVAEMAQAEVEARARRQGWRPKGLVRSRNATRWPA